MPLADALGSRPGRGARLIERTIVRLLMRPAIVNDAKYIAPNFRVIRFQGEALKACHWTPGDKIQVKLDEGLATRTYTPVEWDSSTGETTILAYCHGGGPGSAWAQTTRLGDQRQIMGPKRSLDVRDLPPEVIVFGDETAFGLATVLTRNSAPADSVHHFFEVNAGADASVALNALGLKQAIVMERSQDGAHLTRIADAVLRLNRPATRFVLSGRATSIQYVIRRLKAAGVESHRLMTKAYWAPGKVGLD